MTHTVLSMNKRKKKEKKKRPKRGIFVAHGKEEEWNMEVFVILYMYLGYIWESEMEI